MDAERWQRVERLYNATLERAPADRAAFLQHNCGGDEELRREVEEMLALAEQHASFMERPALEIALDRDGVATSRLRGALEAAKARKPGGSGGEFRLAPGARLGPYEVLAPIGAGGMGEVYRARDSRLGRTVAIKILPEHLSSNAQLRERFLREARTISGLNHPHICTLHDLGCEDGVDYVVMEYLEGETLAQRLKKGPLPPDRALEYAMQITDALDTAHRHGVIHRDVKPGNIMLTKKGAKLLDFGLARQQRLAPGSVDTDLTDEGMVLGTASYMAPEQVRGQLADQRSDLFSFGVALYEMLCGKRAFAGDSSMEVMHAILKDEPPELPASVPQALDRIVRRCLEKEPDRRFQSAADLALALQQSSPSSPRVAAPKRRAWPKWAAVAAAFLPAIGAVFLWLSRPLPPPRVTGMVQITNDGRGNGAPMLTDGTRLLFNLAEEPRQISVKGGEPVPLSLPMRNAWLADISPDRTEFLMYRYHDSEGGLERLELWAAPLLGGSPRRLGNLLVTTRFGLDTGNGFPVPRRGGRVDVHQSTAAWSPDGQQLVYARDMELHLAKSDGTEVRKLATFAGEPFFVRWSPDGRSLRLSVSNAVVAAGDTAASLWEVSIDDGRVRPLLPGWDPSRYNCCGNWTPDGKYFVFQSGSNIWALREKAGFLRRTRREPVQLTNGPMAAYWPLPSLDGKRLFIAGYQPRNEFLRYDLKSRRFVSEFAGVSGDNLEFSRDGKWVTYVSFAEGSLFRSGADGSQRLQLTWPPLGAGMPHWSPDGKQITFVGGGPPGKPARIYVVPFDGGPPRQVSNGESGKSGDIDPSWPPDGASLAFSSVDGDPAASIHVVDLKTNHVSALPGSEGMWSPRWSPDGRFIAGLSGSSPGTQAQPFNNPNKLMLYDLQTRKQTQLSNLPSAYPSWSRDGEFLFFESQSDQWVCRVRMRDRKVERITDLSKVRVAGFGWFAAAPNNSFITARDAGTAEIYALDWEAP